MLLLESEGMTRYVPSELKADDDIDAKQETLRRVITLFETVEETSFRSIPKPNEVLEMTKLCNKHIRRPSTFERNSSSRFLYSFIFSTYG